MLWPVLFCRVMVGRLGKMVVFSAPFCVCDRLAGLNPKLKGLCPVLLTMERRVDTDIILGGRF